MNLLERAKALKAHGFLDGEPAVEPEELVRIVEEDPPCDPEEAPATSLLLAAKRVLEIPADAAVEPEEFEQLLAAIQTFCGDAFTVTEVRATVKEGPDSEAGPAELLRLRFKLDGRGHDCELILDEEMVDLGFLHEIDTHLGAIGEARRLCPIVELMDDTARYVFIEPEKMERAELEQVIDSPDFEADF